MNLKTSTLLSLFALTTNSVFAVEDDVLQTPLSRVGLWSEDIYKHATECTNSIECIKPKSQIFTLYKEPNEKSEKLGYLSTVSINGAVTVGIYDSKFNGRKLKTFSETTDWGYTTLYTYTFVDKEEGWYKIPTPFVGSLTQKHAWVNLEHNNVVTYYIGSHVTTLDFKEEYVILDIKENGIIVRPYQENHDMPCETGTPEPLKAYTEELLKWSEIYSTFGLLQLRNLNPRGC